jgi:hypothetical protein
LRPRQLPSGRFFVPAGPGRKSRPTSKGASHASHLYLPHPAGAKRPKSGGRKKGSLNKSTIAMREAILQVFADMQATTGRENGHFLDWALGNATDFYKLTARLLRTRSPAMMPSR